GNMGVKSIVSMVIATAAPLTIMVANTPLIIAAGNGPAAPLDFIVAMGIMLLFSVGFISMSRYINDAGAFYACIQKGLGRIVGLGSATLMMTSYGLLLIALATYVGVTISDLVGTLLNTAIPWWVSSLSILSIIAYFGYRRIELSSKFLGVALILEIAAVIIVNTLVVHEQGVKAFTFETLGVNHFMSSSPGIGVLLAIYAFIGFESTIIYREEAKDPERTIPIATYVAVFSLGLFYVVSMWCVVAGIGVENVIQMATEHPADMYLKISEIYGGKLFAELVQILVITSLFACMLSLHNIVVRYKYTLGKYGIFPPHFSNVHEHHGSPYFSSVVLSLLSILSIVFLATTNLDPVGQIYVWGATLGTLGYMVVLAIASSATLVFFRRHKDSAPVWNTLIAPCMGMVGVVGCVWVAFSNLPMLTGGSEGSALASIMGVMLFLFFCFGIIIALKLKRKAPDRYAALLNIS
ncbi:APC family permease, partial [Pseudomonas sp. PA-3-6E]